MPHLRTNILYSSFLAIANYLFPLLVYPYISRVLGVTNIGICNFVDSIIHYFILFSMMGITIIGTREISFYRNDKNKVEKAFSSLLTLNAMTTLIALAALVVATLIVPELRQYKLMMTIGGLKLLSNFFLIEWVYKGLENFRFITIRTIIVKCIYVVSVYIFVREAEDYPIYYLLTTLMITINAAINSLYSSKFISFKFKSISLRAFLGPFLILGLYMLITSMCTTFNVAYLGFVTNETEVGYYTTATKLYTILLALFTGATTAIMPHMSSLLSNGDKDGFINILNKASHVLFAFSIPVILFSVIYSNDVILLISGKGYQGAVIPMQIVMPLMLIIGYEQIIVIQGLMPLSKDKIVMKNAFCGGTLSVTLNIILVPILLSIGSAIVWVCSELLILILSQIALNKILSISFPWKYLNKNILGYLPLLCLLLATFYFLANDSYWINLLIGASITAIYTLVLQLWIFHNPIIISSLKFLKSKFSK